MTPTLAFLCPAAQLVVANTHTAFAHLLGSLAVCCCFWFLLLEFNKPTISLDSALFYAMPTKRAISPSPRKPASAATKRADISPSAVALYVPNLIGYFRLITGIAALYYAPFHGKQQDTRTYFLAFYFVSYMADALDGTAARALNQTSKFGQVAPEVLIPNLSSHRSGRFSTW